MSSTSQGSLAYQGGTLVHVTPRNGGTTSAARRWNGSNWSSFTSLSPVQSVQGELAVFQGGLFYVYSHDTICCGADRAGLVKINLP